MKLRIASYNIRKSVGLDWKRRPDRILRILAEIDADVVLLQEADRRFGSRAGTLPAPALEQHLGYKILEVSTREQSHGWHGNALLVRDQYQVSSVCRVKLPCIEPRGAVSATIDFQDDKSLCVVGVHLSLLKTVRRWQYRAIEKFLSKNNSVQSIVAGDFNERGEISAEFFSNAFVIHTPQPTFHTQKPIWSLDRFIASNNVNMVQCQTFKSDAARIASDHFPIVADLLI